MNRNFIASKPNEKRVTDITYIQYGSVTLYLSTIMDLYNNEIVTYKLYNHQQTPLVMDTLREALIGVLYVSHIARSVQKKSFVYAFFNTQTSVH